VRERVAEPDQSGKRRKQKAGRGKTKGKGGRKKGASGPFPRAKASERGTRIERQRHQDLPAMLAGLPRQCDIGVKQSSQGRQQYWRGYVAPAVFEPERGMLSTLSGRSLPWPLPLAPPEIPRFTPASAVEAMFAEHCLGACTRDTVEPGPAPVSSQGNPAVQRLIEQRLTELDSRRTSAQIGDELTALPDLALKRASALRHLSEWASANVFALTSCPPCRKLWEKRKWVRRIPVARPITPDLEQ
jgi:hypothetical protein